jgi:superfamily II DNA or RNA helicase
LNTVSECHSRRSRRGCASAIWEGIRCGLLAPFHYFGVPDEVDYRNIPWRSTRFDEEALTRAVATQSRAQNALEQYRLRAGARTLAFCCSTRHADFMAQFFTEAGVQAVAVHSDTSSAPRTASLERSVAKPEQAAAWGHHRAEAGPPR